MLLALWAAPAAAELKYTMHMEIKKSAGGPVNPMMAIIGEQFTKMVPAGGADLVYTVGEEGVRVEYLQAAMNQPAGTVVIARKSGEMFALQPADKTYWKVAVPDMTAQMAQAGLTPKTSIKATGEFAEIAGVRAERLAFEWSLDLPIPEEQRASLPPDFPTSISMSGDNWVSRDKKLEKYGAMVAGNKAVDFLAALGLDKLASNGIVLRSAVRVAGNEMRGEITKIAEEPAPAGFLTIPEGFKEIPQPQPVIR